jgi:methylated-DNA-[protein]-cysteine S-methyltransferase
MPYTSLYSSPVGEILLSSDGQSLTGLWFLGQKYFALNLGEQIENNNLPVLLQTKKWLDRYFEGKNPSAKEISLKILRSDFSRLVCSLLTKIPYGRLTNYGALAQTIASSQNRNLVSSQAVGQAVGHNPISIIIPCHRVVGKDGNLRGYAASLDTKEKLLALEGIDLELLSKYGPAYQEGARLFKFF